MNQKFYIDSALIAKRGACSIGRQRFERVFGTNRVLFNKKNWDKANKENLNLIWLAAHVIGWPEITKLEDDVGFNNVYGSYPNTNLFTKKFSNLLYEAIKVKLKDKVAA